MPKAGDGLQNQLSPREWEILEGFISKRNNDSATSERTQAKTRHLAYKLCGVLHDMGKTLDTATYEDFAAIPGKLKNKEGKPLTKNSRQSFVSQLKAMVAFMKKTRKIKGDESLLSDVVAGTPTVQNKGVLTPDEWERVLNAPMSAKDRAYLAVLYDGYHRPFEPYTLKWSDLKTNDAGAIQYQITFKTGKPRTIVQKPGTTAVLEAWRRESGHNYGDNAYVFPDNNGQQYKTLMAAIRLFTRLRQSLNLEITPGGIRNTAISHDVDALFPTTYICMRAWGEPHNDMINVYVKANSARMQMEAQARSNNGHPVKIEPVKPREIKTLKECPACHQKNAIDGAFCIYCGANMDGSSIGIIKDLQAQVSDMKRQMDVLLELEKHRTAMAGSK